ncbi:MAG TPA: transglutaminase domain-containing protein [Alphaproteobacteria bacterium]|nr:transglutaminase domain-containing protein [Alphaproteobacteria bacterium]USO06563.1 MAG: transglutaminase domain-containing protein [Rhodospirillales bacterium]HOO81183.1 transglutaminase domain-containing protein [Alphaproteobacteria bacterium]
MIITASMHNVSKTITKDDERYIHKIISAQNYDWQDIKHNTTFEEELEDIRAIQSAVLNTTPLQKQVPDNRPREPKDLFELGYAQCSDRSRVIDKMLRLAGFETRVASLYSTAKTGSAIKSLLSNDKDLVHSHSIVEVKTRRGWMMVDTNEQWLGLDKEMQPVSLERWYTQVKNGNSDIWHTSNEGKIYWLMEGPYTFVYGLYSRHGYFYPPYNCVPDINWPEFRYNFFRK